MSSRAPESVGVADAKRRFADLLGAARHRGARFVIERRGTPVAALVSLDDLARLEEAPAGGGDPADRGFLRLVGAFEHEADFADAVEEAVRGRPAQRAGDPPAVTE